jgi:hypothetical protein
LSYFDFVRLFRSPSSCFDSVRPVHFHSFRRRFRFCSSVSNPFVMF